MTTANDTVLFTCRGTLIAPDLESGRKIHNATAGSEAGIAAARSLGDLSHKVYVPATAAGKMAGKAGDVLFIDVWLAADGIGKFFANPEVQAQGEKIFSSKVPTVWMRARGAYSIELPAPSGRNERYVGMIRGKVASPEKAIESFRNNVSTHFAEARKRGQLSHEIFFKMGPPGEAPELLGIDVWADLKGMQQHYAEGMEGLHGVFAGEPEASIWESQPGWSEW